jgi:hypothetical protein
VRRLVEQHCRKGVLAAEYLEQTRVDEHPTAYEQQLEPRQMHGASVHDHQPGRQNAFGSSAWITWNCHFMYGASASSSILRPTRSTARVIYGHGPIVSTPLSIESSD